VRAKVQLLHRDILCNRNETNKWVLVVIAATLAIQFEFKVRLIIERQRPAFTDDDFTSLLPVYELSISPISLDVDDLSSQSPIDPGLVEFI